MQESLTMLVCLGMMQPLMEYVVHTTVHRWKDPMGYHRSHHTMFKVGDREYEDYSGDKNTYIALALGYYLFPQLYLLWLMIAKYEITHMVLHKYPEVFPRLTAHHKEHHRVSTSNYCVSAMWPDKMFCTWRRPQSDVNQFKVLEKMRKIEPAVTSKKLKTNPRRRRGL